MHNIVLLLPPGTRGLFSFMRWELCSENCSCFRAKIVHVSALPETLLSLRYIAARTLFLFAYNANQAAVVDQTDFKKIKQGKSKRNGE